MSCPFSTADTSSGWRRLVVPRSELSPRQLEACRLVGEHLTTGEIAERMGVQPRTAKQFLDESRRKLGVNRMRQIPARLKELGL